MIATTLALLTSVNPAHAWSPVLATMECPLGGEEFSGYFGNPPPIDRPFALDGVASTGGHSRTQCPNGFPLYRSFTKGEVQQIALLETDPEWPEVATRPYWNRVWWIEAKLGTLTLQHQETIAWYIIATSRSQEDAERAYRLALPIYIEHANATEPTDPASTLMQARKLRVIAYLSWLLGEDDPATWLAQANAVFDPIRLPKDAGPRPTGDRFRGFERRAGITEACLSQPVKEFGKICQSINKGSLTDFDKPEIAILFGKFFLDPSANSMAVDQAALECEIYSRIGFTPKHKRCGEERPVIRDALVSAYPEEARAALEQKRRLARHQVVNTLKWCEHNPSSPYCKDFDPQETMALARKEDVLKSYMDVTATPRIRNPRKIERQRRFGIAWEGACAFRTEFGLECRTNERIGFPTPPNDLEGTALDDWIRQAGREKELRSIIQSVASCLVLASLGQENGSCSQSYVQDVKDRGELSERLAKAKTKFVKRMAESLGRNEAVSELGFVFGNAPLSGLAERRARFLETYPEATQWEREARQDTIRRYTTIR